MFMEVRFLPQALGRIPQDYLFLDFISHTFKPLRIESPLEMIVLSSLFRNN